MITRYPVLRQRIKESGVTIRELSVVTGVNVCEFYLKLWGIKRWSLTDAVRICCFFRCPDAEHLFVQKHSKTTKMESQGNFGNK